MNRNLALILPLLLLQFPSLALEKPSSYLSQVAVDNSSCKIKAENGDEYSDKQLQTLAKRITLRVIGDNNGGSGTLLAKKGNSYLVVTNSHVVRGVNSISLQTSDGKTYSAQIVPKTNFDKFDLALLQFQSNQNYCLPKEIAASVPDKDMPVIAAGYSSEKGEIVFRKGTVQQIASRPLKEGYQIGYSSNIEQGMSGGAILNSRGELVGINGRSAYPILNTGYVYPDGSRLTDEEIQRMRKLSWGIPTSTFLAQVNSDILTAYYLPLPNNSLSIPEIQWTGWLGELEQKAKEITVRIDSSSHANGSGIIIAKDGDTYTVLTAAHVVCERQDYTQPCGNFKYQIFAPDGKQYSVETNQIKIEKGVDLAVVKFTSKKVYKIATLADYNSTNGDYAFTAGYPKLGEQSPWRFTAGQVASKEQGLFFVKNTDSSIPSTGSLLSGGYELVYTSITYGGMSGGPVLDSKGRVIGIHGRADAEQAYDQKTGDCGLTSKDTCQTQIGVSLGIPVRTFLGLATRLGVQPLHVEKTPAPQLDAQKVQSIEKATLSADVSTGNATASQWLERGNQLLRLSRDEEAIKAFDEVIKLKPSFIHLAYFGKGWALADQKKYQEAQAAFEQAVSYKSDFAIAWRLQSFMYLGLEKWEQGLVAINKTIQLQPKNQSGYLLKAFILISLKKYQEAEAVAKQAIIHGENALAYFIRGVLYEDNKKKELAILDFNKAIEINPRFFEAYLVRGVYYYRDLKFDAALNDFNKVIEINPESTEAYLLRGALYQSNKKWDLAEADYTKVIALKPQDSNGYYKRAKFYKSQQKWNLAEADYTKVIALKPQDLDGYYKRAEFYEAQQKWDLAEADYTKVIVLKPQDSDRYYKRAEFYEAQQKWDLAEADYTKVIALRPQDSDRYYKRARFYEKQQKWDLALADYSKIILLELQESYGYYSRAKIYEKQQKWDLALADYSKIILLKPQESYGYHNRAKIYEKQQKWDLALADYNKAIEIKPQDSNGYSYRAEFYEAQQKWDLALADYNKAIELKPQLVYGYYTRAEFYERQQKWDLAEADYTKFIALKLKDRIYANGYYKRAEFYERQQKWDLAEADYTKVIALKLEDRIYANGYYKRAEFYERQQKWDLAEADYTKVIALKLEDRIYDGYGYYKRAEFYERQQKWDLALADYNKFVELNPQDSRGYYKRVKIYEEQQKWDLAEADYNKFIELKPQNLDSYYKRAKIYEEQQKWDLALADYNKIIELKPQDSNSYANRAMFYQRHKKWDLALADCNKIIEIDRQSPTPYYIHGLTKYEQGAIDEAIQKWEKAIQISGKSPKFSPFALAIAIYNKGEQEKAYQLAETALRQHKDLADVKVLKNNSWGERLINDAEKLLSSPRIQSLLSQIR
ncbi:MULTISPECIES: serine protease [Nostoc]|uniref:Tetratricopeptide repeat protein n=1 Tax=Nostoc paludosum FACHB-159 TaxID=2692908 RepID=A0ABR8KCY9_9NOSO|nr:MULTISPECIES: serine protease [Nostoc]MBD2680930.1 tetratricopeptide repeat protein [Nostoc sp. FACHB-857]MBD2737406.1 tetratricopeptide repeat protein [Nostoc paludosum FACHB-159]